MAAQWEKLFLVTCDLIDQVNRDFKTIDTWTFGGGTALMLQIAHRQSDDIDIFLDDHQLLPYLDPSRQSFQLSMSPSDYLGDGTVFQKIVFDGVGEIDFIVCPHITQFPARKVVLEGREVMLETVAEIISKKIFYRGANIRPRDIFDLASACVDHREAVVAALASHEIKVASALAQISRSDRNAVTEMIAGLQIREEFRSITSVAVDISADVLREALSRACPTPAS